MDIYVKEYAWMWQRLGLSLAECRVYAYIYGLTNSTKTKQKGYKGSVRALADMLGLTHPCVLKALRHLMQQELIVNDNGLLLSGNTVTTDGNSVTTDGNSVTADGNSVTADGNSVTSSVPPIKEINKEMERNNNIARETLATQKPQTPSDLFEEFLSAYGASHKNGLQQGDLNQMAQNLRECRMLWDSKTPTEQRFLLRDVKEGKWSKPRLDWTISDYQVPEPTNYNGRSFPTGAQMVIAIYNGTGGVYTKADAELYNMTIKKEIES